MKHSLLTLTISIILAIFLFNTSSLEATPFYVANSRGTELFSVDTVTGSLDMIVSMKFNGNIPSTITSLALSQDGILYSVAYDWEGGNYARQLVTINQTTGAINAVGGDMSGLGTNAFLGGLAFSSTGVLYGVERENGKIVTINTSDGSHEVVHDPSGSSPIYKGLTFGSDGSLYGTAYGDIYKININDWSYSLFHDTDYSVLEGIAFDTTGELYASTGKEIVKYTSGSWNTVVTGSSRQFFEGMSFSPMNGGVPPIPEPSTLILLGFGVIGLIAKKR